MAEVAQETIRERARAIWEREGRPAGRDEDIWHLAEQELRLERAREADGLGDPLDEKGGAHRTHGLATGAEHGGA